MEFFVCPCPETGTVILDGNDHGPNKDDAGVLQAKQCNPGRHTVALRCPAGKTCVPLKRTVVIKDTDPVAPLEVAFQCA